METEHNNLCHPCPVSSPIGVIHAESLHTKTQNVLFSVQPAVKSFKCQAWVGGDALQVDSAHVQLAKAQVHHTAAVQQAKQQAQADKARQQRMKTLQKQQAKAR